MNNHFENNILTIEKFDANKVWSVVLFDADQKFYYLKRFQFEQTTKPQNILGENHESQLVLMSDVDFPRFEIVFGGADAYREALIVDAEEFIGVKSFKAKGKRLTTFDVESINELEPIRFKEEEASSENEDESGIDTEPDSNDEHVLIIESTIISDVSDNNDDSDADEEYPESYPVKPKDVIDNQKIIDDITGQMTLF